jgi:hypothetical protein
MSTQQTIPDFEYKPEQYVLHNSRPDPIEGMWAGYRFEVPPVDAVGPKPGHFDDGTPIPGTILLKDAYTFDSDGHIPTSGPHNWKAKEAIRAVLGVGVGTTTATSKFAQNGVSFLPEGCSREVYKAVRAAGEARYRASLVEWAADTLQNYEEGRNRAKAVGVDAKPPGPDFYKAQAVLKAHQDQLRAHYLGTTQESEQVADEDDSLEFEAYARAFAMKIAGKIADDQNVDKAKLVEEMIQDPAVAAKIRRKYSLRKRGYLDPTDAPGAEQPVPE